MELKIDRGLKSYDIEDADGTPLGTIYVNPADLGIAARLDEARKAVQALADGLGDDVDAEKIGDVDRQIKEQVNYIFGSDASAVFFKGILHALESKAPPISLRTYYARREEAIELLSSVLWGYIPIE